MTEVLDGLKEGDRVVTRTNFTIAAPSLDNRSVAARALLIPSLIPVLICAGWRRLAT